MSATNAVGSPPESYQLKQNNFFLNGVSRKFVVTSVISMIFLYAGSLVDTLLVGVFLGEIGLSAMSLVSPVYLIYYTVGATIGIGGSILASRILGTGNRRHYQEAFSCSVWLMILSAVVMTVLGYAFLDPICQFLSGSAGAEAKGLARQYLLYYIPGGAFTLLAYIPLYFLKIEGNPKLSSRLFSLSAILNVLLSWLFLGPVCDMGIGGASLATSISMGVIAVIGFFRLMRDSAELKLLRHVMRKKTIREILVAGLPNGLSNLLESAQILLINMLLLSIGAARFLPCYTVVRNIMGMQNAIIIGVSSALIPLIGVFFGERDYNSERSLMAMAKKNGSLLMLPLIAIVCVIPEPLFRLFGVTDAGILAESHWALFLACIGLVAAYLGTLYTNYLTAIKREGVATLLVFLRTLGLLALFGIPLSRLWGVHGIWLSFSLAEGAGLALYYLIRYGIRKKNPHLDPLLLDTRKEREQDISFSVRNDVEDVVSASQSCSLYCEEHDVDMKRCMRVSMVIEELLVFLIGNCFHTDQEKYVDVRLCKVEDEVMLRFRYIGEIFDPVTFYDENSDDLEMADALLGLKMVFKTATLVNFRQVLGTNNLIVMF